MATQATWVVPPIHEAKLIGVSAVVISARKISLLDLSLKEIGSVRYSKRDNLSLEQPFADLVNFVRQKSAVQPLGARP